MTKRDIKDLSFMFKLSGRERAALEALAVAERSTGAQVIRRLIYHKATSRGLWPEGAGRWEPWLGWIPDETDQGGDHGR